MVMVHLADEVVRQRGATVAGSFAGRDLDWSAPDALTLAAAVDEDTQPASQREVDDRRTETRWRVVLYVGADVRSTDRLVWQGDTYEVVGDVRTLRDRMGRAHHVELLMTRVQFTGRIATMLDQPLQ